jgi:TetR/AcrR family fatty acid metabolism transcriptional regulator
LKLIHDEPAAAEVLTIELRQSNKFMKEYDNAAFADFLRMLGGIVARGQELGVMDTAVPAHVAARMIFGALDELALAWVLARAPTISGSAPGTRPKKFDIVRAADWAVALVTTGLATKEK